MPKTKRTENASTARIIYFRTKMKRSAKFKWTQTKSQFSNVWFEAIKMPFFSTRLIGSPNSKVWIRKKMELILIIICKVGAEAIDEINFKGKKNLNTQMKLSASINGSVINANWPICQFSKWSPLDILPLIQSFGNKFPLIKCILGTIILSLIKCTFRFSWKSLSPSITSTYNLYIGCVHIHVANKQNRHSTN